MRRREFVLRLPVVTGGLAIASLPLGGCAGVPVVSPRVRPDGLVIPSASLPVSGSALVQSPGMRRPIFVHRDADGQAVAVLASCTHQGCQPEPFGDRLVCPCHGSEFTLAGAVLMGPAERPLERFDVVETEGEILVRTSRGVGR